MFVRLALIFVIIAGAMFGGQSNAQAFDPEIRPSEPDLISIRDDLMDMIDRREIPGIAIAVSRGDEILWQEGLGFKNIERTEAMRPDTLMALASTSKSIGTTLLLSLVSEGRISLDDKVEDLLAPSKLGALPSTRASQPTVRDLLKMQAGIGHGWFGVKSEEYLPPERELLPFYGQKAFPAGGVSHYSNWSLGVADLIVERVTGLDLERVARSRLFEPLGMENTYTFPSEEVASRVADSFNSDMSRGSRFAEVGFSVPAGGLGIISSASDLLRFGRYHAGTLKSSKAILSDSLRDLMYEAPRTGPSYAFGFHNVSEGVVSNGNTNRFTSNLHIFRDEKIVIAVLLNRASWDMLPGQISDRIAEALRGKSLESQFTRDQYMEEWETPYENAGGALDGQWTGYVIDPRTGERKDLQILFNGESATVYFRDARANLRNLVLNSHREFRADTIIDDFLAFRPNEDPQAGLNFELIRNGENELDGYVRVSRSEPNYYYALPFLMHLERH